MISENILSQNVIRREFSIEKYDGPLGELEISPNGPFLFTFFGLAIPSVVRPFRLERFSSSDSLKSNTLRAFHFFRQLIYVDINHGWITEEDRGSLQKLEKYYLINLISNLTLIP